MNRSEELIRCYAFYTLDIEPINTIYREDLSKYSGLKTAIQNDATGSRKRSRKTRT